MDRLEKHNPSQEEMDEFNHLLEQYGRENNISPTKMLCLIESIMVPLILTSAGNIRMEPQELLETWIECVENQWSDRLNSILERYGSMRKYMKVVALAAAFRRGAL